jgi:hypothetical protein
MMIIIELILTVISWHRGWRWWALLPLIIAFGIRVSMVLMVGMFAINISEDEFILLTLPLDGVVCIVLTILAVRKPRAVHSTPQLPAAAPEFKLP